MFDKIAVELEMPSLFWAIYVSIGLISIGNFLLYNKWISSENGIVTTRKNFFNSRLSYVGVYSLIGVMVLAGMSAGTTTYTGDETDEEDRRNGSFFSNTEIVSFSEYLNEGGTMEFTINITYPNLTNVNLSLSWTDEPDSRRIIRTYENDPDSFRASIGMVNLTRESVTGSNTHGQPGSIEIDQAFSGQVEYMNYTGEYLITIEMLDAGDLFPGVGVIGLTDQGNSFDLIVEYTYLTDRIPE